MFFYFSISYCVWHSNVILFNCAIHNKGGIEWIHSLKKELLNYEYMSIYPKFQVVANTYIDKTCYMA